MGPRYAARDCRYVVPTKTAASPGCSTEEAARTSGRIGVPGVPYLPRSTILNPRSSIAVVEPFVTRTLMVDQVVALAVWRARGTAGHEPAGGDQPRDGQHAQERGAPPAQPQLRREGAGRVTERHRPCLRQDGMQRGEAKAPGPPRGVT